MKLIFPFRRLGALQVGDYLHGSPYWPYPVTLRRYYVTALAGAAGATTIGLLLDGAESGQSITLTAFEPGSLLRYQRVNATIPADQVLRLRVLAAPAQAAALSDVHLVFEFEPASTAAAVESLWVNWVSETETFPLFDYAGQTFTERTPGLAAGRASLLNAVDFSASIEGTEVAAIVDGVLTAPSWVVQGGVATAAVPRLEFYINTRRVATMSGSGVWRVPDFTETTTCPAAGFLFYGSGAPVASLTAIGLVTIAAAEDTL